MMRTYARFALHANRLVLYGHGRCEKEAGSGFIDLFSMPYAYNKNDEGMIFKPTDETVVSDSVTP
jgi:hypothetical protein